MDQNIIIILAVVLVLFMFMGSGKKENFSTYPRLSVPEIYNCEQCNNKLQTCRHQLGGRTRGLRNQLYNCQNKLKMTKKGPYMYKPYLEKCLDKLDKQKKISRSYYKKFRDLQNKLAYQQVKLNRTEDALNIVQKQLGFCKRYRTLKPTYVGKVGDKYIAPDSITGLGVSSVFQNIGY